MQQLREIVGNPKKFRKINATAWLPAEEGEITSHYWPADAPAPFALEPGATTPGNGRYYHEVSIERLDESGTYLFRYCGREGYGKKPWDAFRFPSSKDCKVQVTTDTDKLPARLRAKAGRKGVVCAEAAAAASAPQPRDVLQVELAHGATQRFQIRRELLTFLAADDDMRDPPKERVPGRGEYDRLGKTALQKLCRERQLAEGGTKAEMKERLRAADAAEPAGGDDSGTDEQERAAKRAPAALGRNGAAW